MRTPRGVREGRVQTGAPQPEGAGLWGPRRLHWMYRGSAREQMEIRLKCQVSTRLQGS